MAKVRVLITDDSELSRALLRSYLEQDADIEIVGEACNGREAVDMAKALAPHVITMDLQMPIMDGITAITEIMTSKAIPILVVSSVADAQNAYDALLCGALDVISKPDYTSNEASGLASKVKMLAGVFVFTRKKSLRDVEPTERPVPLPVTADGYHHIFAIACSTGGPQALAALLPKLPENFSCPIVIAQHISEGFAQGMAEWLNKLCPLTVRLAQEGDQLRAGIIYLAPSEQHMIIASNKRLAFIASESSDIYHPSCDKLLSSGADVFGARTIGIILTGMGKDGAKGIADIRSKGGLTLAQNEATSVIYGMNRVAIEAGNVSQVLTLEAIAQRMIELAGSGV
jgi:two-component system chemotaxis response regulator CheB